MGRWAQRRRRATGPEIPAAAAVNILDIHNDGTDWIITFDGPVAVNLSSPDASLLIDDATIAEATGAGGALASIVYDGTNGYVPGLTWSLSSQPAWLVTPVVFPAGGTTT